MTTPAIRVRHLWHRFGQFDVLRDVSFEVAPGEWDELRQVVTHQMETAADLLVPLDVQVGRGDNWDAAAH